MINVRNYFAYNLRINQIAHLPVACKIIGLTRFLVDLAALVYHVALATLNRNKGEIAPVYWAQAKIDLRGLGRAVIELIPLFGWIGSWCIDSYYLTSAQRLAYRVQEIYQKRIQTDAWIAGESDLVDLDSNTCSSEVQDFINKQQVKISTDQAQIHLFCDQFNRGCMGHAIFSHRKLPFYALAAFVQGKIDRNDMATMMEIYTAKQCFADCHVFRILDDHGEWTGDARAAFLGKMNNKHYLDSGEAPSSEALRQKIAVLPRKKQLMWTHACLISQEELAHLEKEHRMEYLELMYSPIGSLASALVYIHGIKETPSRRQVGLSMDVHCLFLNVKYGTQNSPFIPKLGLFSPKDIQSAVEKQNARLCATPYPGTARTTNLHNSLELPTTVFTHDKIHGHILQHYAPEFINLIKELRGQFKKVTGMSISKETWELVELVAPGCFAQSNVDGLLYYFCMDRSGRRDELSFYELMHNEDASPTPLLWMLLLLTKEKRGTLYSFFDSEKRAIQALEERSVGNSYSLKQKLWLLQQFFTKKDFTAVPADSDLRFEKQKKGLRKNTVSLECVSG